MPQETYQSNQESSGPKEIEYQVFCKVTRELTQARNLDSSFPAFVQAVHRNRELWSILMNDCVTPENILPGTVKTAVISLSLWVDSYSSKAIQENASLDPLIEVNQTIMKGLLAGNQKKSERGAGAMEQVSVT